MGWWVRRSGLGLGQPPGTSNTDMLTHPLPSLTTLISAGTPPPISLVWNGKGSRTRGTALEIEGLSSGEGTSD